MACCPVSGCRTVRAPVIHAYPLRWGRRPGSRAVAREARYYFGVGPEVSLEEIQGVAEHYPVFRIEYAGECRFSQAASAERSLPVRGRSAGAPEGVG
jgi:hypothetical protein